MKELAARLVREVPSEKAVNCLTRTNRFGRTVVHNSDGSRWESTFALRTRISKKTTLAMYFSSEDLLRSTCHLQPNQVVDCARPDCDITRFGPSSLREMQKHLLVRIRAFHGQLQRISSCHVGRS